MAVSKVNNVNVVSFKRLDGEMKATKPPKKSGFEISETPEERKAYFDAIRNYNPGVTVKRRLLKDEKTGLVLEYRDIYDSKSDYFYSKNGSLKYEIKDGMGFTKNKIVSAYKKDGKTVDFEWNIFKDGTKATFFGTDGKRISEMTISPNVKYKDANGSLSVRKSPRGDWEELKFMCAGGKSKYLRFESDLHGKDLAGRVVMYKIEDRVPGKKRDLNVSCYLDDGMFVLADTQGGKAVYNSKTKEITERELMSENDVKEVVEDLHLIDELIFNQADKINDHIEKIHDAEDELRMMKMQGTHFLND